MLTLLRANILSDEEARRDCIEKIVSVYEVSISVNIRKNNCATFRAERIRQAHCFMYNVDKYKQGKFELEPWFAEMPEVMREAVKEYLGWHLLVKARKI